MTSTVVATKTVIATAGPLILTGQATFVPGPAVQLAFAPAPVSLTAGALLTPAPTMQVVDIVGNQVTTAAPNVTLTLSGGSAQAVLAGTSTRAATGGSAAFGDLSIAKSGSSYSRTATASGLGSVSSSPFDVRAGGPTQLLFLGQPPATAGAGVPLGALQVQVSDALGNAVPGATNAVSLALVNAAGATLAGTLTQTPVSGSASFIDLSVGKSGTQYALMATSPGPTAATSTQFAITPGAATSSVSSLAASPSTITANGTQAATVTLQLRDAGGNPIPGASVALVSSGATDVLNPNAGSADAQGNFVATLRASVAGLKTVTATAAGLTLQTTVAANAGPATQLRFTVPPGRTQAAATLAPALQLSIADAQGNTVASANNSITLSLSSGNGASLAGTLQQMCNAGVATFADLSIGKAGSGYKVVAATSGLPSRSSASFDIAAGPPTQLVFITQPQASKVATSPLAPVQVLLQDAQGNASDDPNLQIQMALGQNPTGAALSGNVTAMPLLGIATFSGLTVTAAASGYALTATATGPRLPPASLSRSPWAHPAPPRRRSSPAPAPWWPMARRHCR